MTQFALYLPFDVNFFSEIQFEEMFQNSDLVLLGTLVAVYEFCIIIIMHLLQYSTIGEMSMIKD